MKTRLILAVLASLISTGLNAEERQKLSYPPIDLPLYLECKMKGEKETLPIKDWPGIALYFPDGIAGGFLKPQLVDKHNQLEGGGYGFSIRTDTHWSLIDSEEVPSASGLANIPQLMFLPPDGKGPNFTVLFLKKTDVSRRGFCFGLVGPNAKTSFEASVADPSKLD